MILRRRRLNAAIFAGLIVVLSGAVGPATASADKIHLKVQNNTAADVVASLDGASTLPESAPRAIASGGDFTYTADVDNSKALIVRFSDLMNPKDTLSVTVKDESSPPVVEYGEFSKLLAFVPFPTPIPTVFLFKTDGDGPKILPPPPPGSAVPSE